MLTGQEIRDYVQTHQDEMVGCLSEILKIPSVTGNEQAVSRVFKRYIEDMGLPVQEICAEEGRLNLIADWCGGEGPRFLFNGHMDVFPPTDGDPGTYGPWSGMVADGFVYGRGASDMKGGDCAALMAVHVLKELGFVPEGTVTLSYMCDEEDGGTLGVKYLVEHGYLDSDYGICMEPSNLDLIVGHTGILRAYFTYTGSAASSYRPHPDMDALEKGVAAARAIYRLRDEIQARSDEEYGCPSLSVTTFHAGTATNIFATKCVLSVDRRLVPGETHVQALKEITDVLDKLKEKNPLMEYTVEMISDRPFLDVGEDSEIVRCIGEAHEELFGRKIRRRRRHGGSDAANIFRAYGTQIPNMGPGEESECTKPDEKIKIESYLKMIELYALTVARLLGDR